MADERPLGPKFKFKTPWTNSADRTHLVFSPFQRHLPFAYILAPVAAGIAYFLWRSGQFGILQSVLLAVGVGYMFTASPRAGLSF